MACTDDCLYEPDAIDVSVLLFGRRTCSACGLELAASTDYFAPNRQNASGLVYECRRCRRAIERDRNGVFANVNFSAVTP